MAVFSLFATTFNLSHYHTPYNFFTSLQNFCGDSFFNLKAKGRIIRICCTKVRVVSSHSNPKILRHNRKSRFGLPVSPYDSEDKEEEDDDEDSGGDDWISDKAESSKKRFSRLSEELDIDERWFPLLDYLSTFGLKESHFIQMYERHMPSLQINVDSVEERLGYLLSVGSLGIPESRIGQIITATPSLFSYSTDNSLRPTVRYLLEEIGIEKHDLSKVVQLSPQILVQRIDNTWTTRFNFLTKELRAPREGILSIIGGKSEPKYMYLINELRNEVHSLTKYPTYLSLSLGQRIRPRHRFLVFLKKAPKGPFPLSSLVPTDESFCHQWAGTSKYLEFRERLLLKEFAKNKLRYSFPGSTLRSRLCLNFAI
ncbi:unnamed protein product [Fraxinus pennsylvanica]|uniref:Uncharacterized protein n=1 Tax=Fraxinus pennsylvanica TaxID=56036 RepID=A0AAD2E3A6_9LAMI|nr:unnamed protein product [Fraxinus pennsylvanica]